MNVSLEKCYLILHSVIAEKSNSGRVLIKEKAYEHKENRGELGIIEKKDH